MRRIAVINQKGGVGKTTTTANVGAALAAGGRRVLLIDLDPQAHLTLHYGVDVNDEQPTAYDILTRSATVSAVAIKTRSNIKLVPSDIDLAAAEAELISVMGREVILREALVPVAHDFDVMLIDCPPSLGVLTINALAACDDVLIPLQAQFFALQGLSKLLDTVTLVRQRINRDLIVSGVLLCMHESTTRLGAEVIADLTQFLEGARGTDVPWAKASLFRTRIRRNIKLAEASSFGQTAIEYAPNCNGALDYTAFARELMGELVEETAAPESMRDSLSKQLDAKPDDHIVPSRRPPEPVEQESTAHIPAQAAGVCETESPMADHASPESDMPVHFDPPELLDSTVPSPPVTSPYQTIQQHQSLNGPSLRQDVPEPKDASMLMPSKPTIDARPTDPLGP